MLYLLRLGFLVFLSQFAIADTLTITSTPNGATVDIDDVKTGTTPLQLKVPGRNQRPRGPQRLSA
jgi:hypothetical protein